MASEHTGIGVVVYLERDRLSINLKYTSFTAPPHILCVTSKAFV